MRPFSQSSLPLQHRTSYILSSFCTEDNVQECLLRIGQVGYLKQRLFFTPAASDTTSAGSLDSWTAFGVIFVKISSISFLSVIQEVASLGLPPVWSESGSSSGMNAVAVLNCMHDLIQLHHRSLRSLESLELEQHKSISNVDYLQLTSTRLKVK